MKGAGSWRRWLCWSSEEEASSETSAAAKCDETSGSIKLDALDAYSLSLACAAGCGEVGFNAAQNATHSTSPATSTASKFAIKDSGQVSAPVSAASQPESAAGKAAGSLLDAGIADALTAAATAAAASAAAFTQLHSLQPLHAELKQLAWLGSGTGGRVYSGLWRGSPVAAKLLVSCTPDEVRESMREALLGRVASHPHTVQCFASFSGYVTEQDVAPRAPEPPANLLTPASSMTALVHLDLDMASAAGTPAGLPMAAGGAGAGGAAAGSAGTAVAECPRERSASLQQYSHSSQSPPPQQQKQPPQRKGVGTGAESASAGQAAAGCAEEVESGAGTVLADHTSTLECSPGAPTASVLAGSPGSAFNGGVGDRVGVWGRGDGVRSSACSAARARLGRAVTPADAAQLLGGGAAFSSYRSPSLRRQHSAPRGSSDTARQLPHLVGPAVGTRRPGGGGGGGGDGGSNKALRLLPAIVLAHRSASAAVPGNSTRVLSGVPTAGLGSPGDAVNSRDVGANVLGSTTVGALQRNSCLGLGSDFPSGAAANGGPGSEAGDRRSLSIGISPSSLGGNAVAGNGVSAVLDKHSLSLMGGASMLRGQSRNTLTLSDLLMGSAMLGLAGGDEGGGGGTFELWQVLAASGALPGRYCTLVIMEMCDHGTLQQEVQRRPFHAVRTLEHACSLVALLRTALEVAQGMCHLHSLDIVHGDLKPSNVLLQSNGSHICLGGTSGRALEGAPDRDVRGYTAKVADFGLASKVQNSSTPPADDGPAAGTNGRERRWGSLPYLAPEVPEDGPTKRSDVWSFGMLLYFMCCTRSPYSSYTSLRPAQLLMGIVEGSLSLDWPPECYRLLRRLSETCCQRDPRARPPFSRIVPALQRLVRHICSHPAPSAVPSPQGSARAPSASASASASARASASASACNTAAWAAWQRVVPGVGLDTRCGDSSDVDVCRSSQGMQHLALKGSASMNHWMDPLAGPLAQSGGGGCSGLPQEPPPSPLLMFASCLTLPASRFVPDPAFSGNADTQLLALPTSPTRSSPPAPTARTVRQASIALAVVGRPGQYSSSGAGLDGSSMCVADCSVGACHDDSSATYNAAFGDTAQMTTYSSIFSIQAAGRSPVRESSRKGQEGRASGGSTHRTSLVQ